jgi:hypothetical protein
LQQSITSRPTRDAEISPTHMSRSSRTGLMFAKAFAVPAGSRTSQGIRLSITTIMATVVSATGAALAAAAVVTRIPRSYNDSVTSDLTLPAEWATSLRFDDAADSIESLNGAVPQPVIATSASRSSGATCSRETRLGRPDHGRDAAQSRQVLRREHLIVDVPAQRQRYDRFLAH